MYNYYILILSILLSISFQLVFSNDITICTHLDIDSLFNNVNFIKLKDKINSVLTANKSPLNNKLLLDSVISNTNPCPFRERVVQKLSKNQNIDILVLGGGNAYGSNLNNESIKFRWSNLLEEYLNSGWYNGKFNIDNIAFPNANIDHWVGAVQSYKGNIDFIITDFVSNGSNNPFDQKEKNSYIQFIHTINNLPSKPSILFFNTLKFGDKFLPIPVENLMYNNRVVYFKNAGANIGVYSLYKTADISKYILEEYELPSAYYRDAIYPDFFNPPEDLYEFWSMKLDEKMHKYIADFLFNTFFKLLEDSIMTNKCQKSIKGYENPFKYCDRLSYL